MIYKIKIEKEFETLKNANLQNAELIDFNLQGKDLRDSNLTNANLFRTNLTKAILRGADLTEASLLRTNFTEADLRGANLNTDLTNANLTGALYNKYTQFPKDFNPKERGMILED